MKQKIWLILSFTTILSAGCSPFSKIEWCKVPERNISETLDFKLLWSEPSIFVVYHNELDPALVGLNSTVFAVVYRFNSIPSEIVALDSQSGQMKWQRKVNVPVTMVTSDPSLYVGSYDYIQEYDPQTGKVVSGTSFPNMGNIYNVFINDQILYAYSSSGRWLSYNLEDHTSDSSERFLPHKPFIIDNGILYSYDSEGIKATNIASEETLWKYPINAMIEPINLHPLFIDNMIIILTEAGSIYSLDRENGNLIWKAEANVLSNVVADASQLYFLTKDGYLKVLSIDDGRELQKLQISSNPFGVNSPRSDIQIGVYNIWADTQSQTVVFSLGDSCQLMALRLNGQ